jgi:hypothetical protein
MISKVNVIQVNLSSRTLKVSVYPQIADVELDYNTYIAHLDVRSLSRR